MSHKVIFFSHPVNNKKIKIRIFSLFDFLIKSIMFQPCALTDNNHLNIEELQYVIWFACNMVACIYRSHDDRTRNC